MGTAGGRLNDWISILGLYTFDPTLFDTFHIPEALDKEALISEMLSRYAELEVLYPDAEVFKKLLEMWSKTRLPVWQHLYDTTMYKYEPLNNYNMKSNNKKTGNETSNTSDILNGSRNEGITRKENRDISRIENDDGDTKINDKELTKGNDAYKEVEQDNNWVYGFNSNEKTLRNSEDKTTNGTDEWNTDRTDNKSEDWRRNEKENTNIVGNIQTDLNRKDIDDRNIHATTDTKENADSNAFGNTGIYSRQMLIQQEREIAEFSVYDYILVDFKKRFLLQVW